MPVLDEGRKTLAETVNRFAHGNVEPLSHVGVSLRIKDVGERFAAGYRPLLSAEKESDLERSFLGNSGFGTAGLKRVVRLRLRRLSRALSRRGLKFGAPLSRTDPVCDRDAKDIRYRRTDLNPKKTAVRHVSAMLNCRIGRINDQGAVFNYAFKDFFRVLDCTAEFVKPHAVRELHGRSPFWRAREKRIRNDSILA